MTVEIINMQGGTRGGNPLNGAYFADSFQRGDQPFFTGDKWQTVLTGRTGFIGVQIEAMINVSGNNLVLTGPGAGSGVYVYLMPTPLNYYVLSLFPQFSEAEYRGDGAVGALNSQSGPCVFAQPNTDVPGEGMEMYGANTFFDGVNKTLYAARGNLGAINVVGGATVIGVGDICRIECTPHAGFNTVEYFVNGVSKGSANDNSGNRPQFGMPGFNFGLLAAGITSSWRNFKCGVLPQKSTLANWPL
jgi:hypothetical protein